MTRPFRLLWASLAVFAAGLFLTVQSTLTWPRSARQLRGRIATLEQLRELERAQGHDEEAVALFDRLPAKKPLALNELAAELLPGVQSSIRLRESRPAAAGWTVRNVEASFENVRLADLSRFLERALAASDRPPWRLVECSITASPQGGAGTGRASLTLEALEKTGSAADQPLTGTARDALNRAAFP